MGSGCIGVNSFGNNCPEKYSDKCILYTGDPIESLGICTGDTLSEIENIILTKLQQYALGEGITLSGITANCDFVTQALANKDKNLFNLLQTLFDSDCSLRALITEVQNNQNPSYSFDLKCLTVANPTRDNITQELINQLCNLQSTVNSIVTQLENPETDDNTELITALTNIAGNLLGSNISACPTSSIVKTGTGATTQLNLVGFIPIGGIIEYNGSLGNFDQTGKGLASACLQNFALCNGQNGTKNKLGLVTAMATNIQGGTPLAQATISGDTDTLTNVGNIKGLPKVTLTSVNQIPDHQHNVTETPHTHTANGIIYQNSPDFGNGGAGVDTWGGTVTTSASTTGVQVGSVKNRTASQAIENRQPTYYGIFIQRIS